MIYLFHGDDNAASRTAYSDHKDSSSINYDAANLDLAELSSSLQGGGMFENENKIFIDNLFSKKSSKMFDSILEILNTYSKTANIYLYSDKELGKKDLGVFKNSQAQSFKIPQNLWSFLDGIRPNNSHNVLLFKSTLTSNEPEIVFAMLVRQFRLLLGISGNSNNQIDEVARLAPWQKGKLERQLSLFGQDKVKNIYKKLYKIEKQTKTGGTNLTLTQSIDILLLQI